MPRLFIHCVSITFFLVIFSYSLAHGQGQVRIVTYNIKFLDADKLGDQDDREAKIEDIIELPDADIIAL